MNRRSAQSLAVHQIAAATAVFSAVMFSAIPARSQGAVFIDGSAATALFGGPFAGGGAVGMLLSPRYDLRLEVEVARWRAERVSERSSNGSFDFTNGSRRAEALLMQLHITASRQRGGELRSRRAPPTIRLLILCFPRGGTPL
jgi:hypothetical protein